MKNKKLFLFITFLFATATSQAQFKFGITGGLNISQFHVSDDTYKEYVDKNQPGFIIGPTVIYTIPKTRLGFDVSALYDLRGAKSKTFDNIESVYCKSFQIPINIRYGLNLDDMIYAFVFSGPQFGFNLGSKDNYIISGTGRTTGHTMERSWVYDKTTFSWNFGIGGVLFENIQVRISYNLALGKTGEIQQTDMVDNTSRILSDGKVSAFQIALSYLF